MIGKLGRPRGSRNKRSTFDRGRCLDILHEVAGRPETQEFSVYQVLDEAARLIVRSLLPHADGSFKASQIERIRKQLQRDQAENDARFFAAAEAAEQQYDDESRAYDDADPDDGPPGPPPIPWEETLEEYIRNSEEDFRTLPQGYIHQAMKESFVTPIGPAVPVKRRRRNTG